MHGWLQYICIFYVINRAYLLRIYVQTIMSVWTTVKCWFSIFGRCLNEHKWFVVFFSAVVGMISLIEASALGKTTLQFSNNEVPIKYVFFCFSWQTYHAVLHYHSYNTSQIYTYNNVFGWRSLQNLLAGLQIWTKFLVLQIMIQSVSLCPAILLPFLIEFF